MNNLQHDLDSYVLMLELRQRFGWEFVAFRPLQNLLGE